MLKSRKYRTRSVSQPRSRKSASRNTSQIVLRPLSARVNYTELTDNLTLELLELIQTIKATKEARYEVSDHIRSETE